MKRYKVYITGRAFSDLRIRIGYLRDEKKSMQAAQALFDDYRETRSILANIAGALADPDDEKLKRRGLKRINFLHHNYFMLFKIEKEKVFIVRVFHGLEDYQNKL